MRALSILQPWAWLIVQGHKDIENRTWYSGYTGPFLVHAGKTYSRRCHDEHTESFANDFGIVLPRYEDMRRGGVVGKATMAGCVMEHSSPWKMHGTYGFVLRDQEELPFVPWRGQLGWFDVPTSALTPNAETHS